MVLRGLKQPKVVLGGFKGSNGAKFKMIVEVLGIKGVSKNSWEV